MILVSGATGLVGSHILYQLVLEHDRVRAMYRTAHSKQRVAAVFACYSNTPEMLLNKIEWIQADILDIPSLEDAFKGVSQVYHSAGMVSFEDKDTELLREINIQGTANMVNMALAYGISKFCHISSIATLDTQPKTSQITEKTHWNPQKKNSAYAISKYGAEMEVWRASQEGLEVIILQPGVVLGPCFWHSSSGVLFSEIQKGLRFYSCGSTGFVSATDLACVAKKAMQSAIANTSYIVVAESTSFKAICTQIADLLRVKAPKIGVTKPVLRLLQPLDAIYSAIAKTPRKINNTLIRSYTEKNSYSNTKIKSDLNYCFEPLIDTLSFICKVLLAQKK